MDDAGNGTQLHFPDGGAWTAQPYVLPWSASDYDDFASPVMEPCYPPVTNSKRCSFSYPVQAHYSRGPPFNAAPLQPANTNSAVNENSDESDSDTDDPKYDSGLHDSQQEPSPSSTHSEHKSRQTRPPVLKLGKWSMTIEPYTQPEQRHYICPFSTKPDANGRICHQPFLRPEHLRRHVKTVHGNKKEYLCKVPKCQRAFSRGDNLRVHYWTHLNHGGRAGRNDKMSLAELKAILGPKERKLMRRLKQRLCKQREKQRLKV